MLLDQAQTDSEMVATVLFETYEEIYPNLKYSEVLKITQKLLKSDEELTQDSMKNIAKSAKPYFKKINNLRESKKEERKRTMMMANEVPQTNTGINKIILPKLEESLVYKNAFVLIDSKDRDTIQYVSHNPFTIHFGDAPSRNSSRTLATGRQDKNPSINRKFTDVHMITIKRVIIPTTTYEMPYLVLQIPELGANLYGNNDNISGSFGYLSSGVSNGDYTVYSFDSNDEQHQMSKIFNPRIEISRMTFIIKKQDGSTLEFDDSTKSIVVELEISILHREFKNNSFNVPNS